MPGTGAEPRDCGVLKKILPAPLSRLMPSTECRPPGGLGLAYAAPQYVQSRCGWLWMICWRNCIRTAVWATIHAALVGFAGHGTSCTVKPTLNSASSALSVSLESRPAAIVAWKIWLRLSGVPVSDGKRE